MAHFAEDLDDKYSRFFSLHQASLLDWKREFRRCVLTSSRDITLLLKKESDTVEIKVRAKDPLKKVMKRAEQAFAASYLEKIVFPFWLENQEEAEDMMMKIEDDSEEQEAAIEDLCTLPHRGDGINRITDFFWLERRHQRKQRQLCKDSKEKGMRINQKLARALVVLDDGNDPHRRLENPPLVTYLVNSFAEGETVGHFLFNGCMGHCMCASRRLTDM